MDISQIKKLRDEATQGKWEVGFSGSIYSKDKQTCIGEMDSMADSDFVAALPEIADECMRLEERNEILRETLRRVMEYNKRKLKVPKNITISTGSWSEV